MSDPVIVPPTPTVRQGEPIPDSPETIAATEKNVMDIFNKVMPPAQPEKMSSEPPKPAEPSRVSTPDRGEAVRYTPPAPETVSGEPSEAPKPVEPKLPSFIEQQLRGVEPPAAQPQEPQGEEVFPEHPPEFKTPEERNSRYQKWRQEYNNQKEELKRLRNQPPTDPVKLERLTYLETQNKNLQERLNHFTIETNTEFQQRIIEPMTKAWYAAAQVVKDTGGDVAQLQQALRLQGKAQFDALDEIYQEMPESAKLEVQSAVQAYRHLDTQRRAALQDAPRTVAELKKRDLERQMQLIDGQKKEMGVLFDEAVRKLRDEAKLEVLQKSSNPDDDWWNKQGDNSVELAKSLYLDNTDMGKMAMACVLAPFADVYRKLWYSAMQRADKAEGILKNKFGSEPSMSESPGNNTAPGGIPSLQEDLKLPFSQVFMREFHRQKQAGVQ